MTKIAVTGGSGKAGRVVVHDLAEHGHDVLHIDLIPPPASDSLPAPAHSTAAHIFDTNINSTYAVFAAAQRLGLQRVVWASSETTLGLPFERRVPDYAPLDE